MAKLKAEDVKKIADLAKIPLKEEEVDRLKDELSETIKYVNKLEEIDTSGVLPTDHTTNLKNISRNDEAAGSLDNSEILTEGKTYNGYFVVGGLLNKD